VFGRALHLGRQDRHGPGRGLGQNESTTPALAEHQRDHSLYAAFAPAEDPKVAVAVIVENAGFGAAAAAPIVRRVFDYWLLGQYPSEQDLAAVRKGQAAAPIGVPRRAGDVPLTPGPDQASVAARGGCSWLTMSAATISAAPSRHRAQALADQNQAVAAANTGSRPKTMALRMASTRCWPQACSVTTSTLAITPR
jgi:hypothetical protein